MSNQIEISQEAKDCAQKLDDACLTFKPKSELVEIAIQQAIDRADVKAIYIVTHSSGEYEDYRTYNLKAFTEKRKADDFTNQLQEEYESAKAAFEPLFEAWNKSIEEGSDSKLPEFSVPNDPHANNWEKPSYSVEEVPLN